jgi:hypothetical protein
MQTLVKATFRPQKLAPIFGTFAGNHTPYTNISYAFGRYEIHSAWLVD